MRRLRDLTLYWSFNSKACNANNIAEYIFVDMQLTLVGSV